ncbi:NAD(P)-dependent oxidoreductase, partial [Streptomyces sp. NPDC051597]
LALPLAVRGHYRRAVADGHGGDNWTRIIDGIREPR